MPVLVFGVQEGLVSSTCAKSRRKARIRPTSPCSIAHAHVSFAVE